MICPFCGNGDTQVKDSRPAEDGAAIRRRRLCGRLRGRIRGFAVEARHLRCAAASGVQQALRPGRRCGTYVLASPSASYLAAKRSLGLGLLVSYMPLARSAP